VKLGIVTDVHLTLDPAARAAWHNDYDFARLPERIDRACAHFERADVDAVVVGGDLTNAGDEASARAAVERLSACLTRPLRFVAGNHDLDERDDQLERCGCELLTPSGFELDRVRVAGVAIERGESGAFRYTAAEAASVVVSHFPVLSRAERVAERGLAYPGDLVNRRELRERLARAGPVLVLNGHIHVREAHAEDNVLQLSAGALVEPPYEAAIVDVRVSRGEARVRRHAHALGPPAGERDPVLAPADETWTYDGAGWTRAPA
jgi:predicted phosphodiesterase